MTNLSNGIGIEYKSHTVKWYRVLWYWLCLPYRFFFPPKLTESNLCTLEELMSGKFVDQDGNTPQLTE